MHPKYQKKPPKASKKGKAGEGKVAGDSEKVIDEDRKRQMRLFPGLAMPDTEWQPSYIQDSKKEKISGTELGVDEMMAELEGVKERVATGQVEGERRRDNRSLSPGRRRGRSPDYDRRGGDSRDGDRGRDGYGRGGSSGRPLPKRMDDKPVIYKVYPGKVAGIKDFGAFVTLEGVAGRAEGTRASPCHGANM